MNCHRVDCSDCCHISHQDNHWFCDIREERIANPDLDGCLYYETKAKHDLLIEWDQALNDFKKTIDEFAEEWHQSVVRSVRNGTIIITIGIALTILIWSLT